MAQWSNLNPNHRFFYPAVVTSNSVIENFFEPIEAPLDVCKTQCELDHQMAIDCPCHCYFCNQWHLRYQCGSFRGTSTASPTLWSSHLSGPASVPYHWSSSFGAQNLAWMTHFLPWGCGWDVPNPAPASKERLLFARDIRYSAGMLAESVALQMQISHLEQAYKLVLWLFIVANVG